MDVKSKEFKKLQGVWYKKLKDSGFEDAEQEDGNLKVWASYFFKVRKNHTLDSAKEEYYRAAGHFLHEYKFENETQRLIWELHSEGQSVRAITATLKDTKGIKTHKDRVWAAVHKLSEIMMSEWKKRN